MLKIDNKEYCDKLKCQIESYFVKYGIESPKKITLGVLHPDKTALDHFKQIMRNELYKMKYWQDWEKKILVENDQGIKKAKEIQEYLLKEHGVDIRVKQ